MKNTFIGYYRPSDSELKELWESCTFILDANVLLNFYRYSKETSSEVFKILHKIESRIWVPHQAALEYQKRRLDVIAQQEKSYNEALKFSTEASRKIKDNLLSNWHPFISDSEIITRKLDELFEEVEEKLNEGKAQCQTIIKKDSIREELTSLLDGKVGEPYREEKYKDIYDKGKKRYDKKIPPGYEDQKNKNGGREYGDLIFWFQTLDFAKNNNKSIILITDEKKEDWWQKHQGKIIGPRPELVEEIKEYSSVSFYMYRVDPFMHHAEKFLNQQIKSKAIEEVRETRYRDDEKIAAITKHSKFIEEYARVTNVGTAKALATASDFADVNSIAALAPASLAGEEVLRQLKSRQLDTVAALAAGSDPLLDTISALAAGSGDVQRIFADLGGLDTAAALAPADLYKKSLAAIKAETAVTFKDIQQEMLQKKLL